MLQFFGLFYLIFEHFCGNLKYEKEKGFTWAYMILMICEELKGMWFTQDAEEFPNLAVASERRDRVESPKFQSKQRPQVNFRLKPQLIQA